MRRKITLLFYSHYLSLVMIALVPLPSFSQNPVSVRGLDISQKTNLSDFTLTVIHEKDTVAMVVPTENASFMILPGECEVILQKTGYQIGSTDKWFCPSDTANISIEFRLLKENATHWEARIGRRNSRKMGTNDSLSSIKMGGFRKQRAGPRGYFSCIVSIKSNDGLETHCVTKRL